MTFRLPSLAWIAGAGLFLWGAWTAGAVDPGTAARYVRERAWVLEPQTPAAVDLREELDAEISRLLDLYDAGGHVEPAYFEIGITGSWIFHGYPGEQAYVLAEALPFLPTSTQARVKSYLFDEIRAYDPTDLAFEHCDWGWGACEMTGNRREFFAIPASPDVDPLTPNLWPPPRIPAEGLYMIWRYCDATEDWGFISGSAPASGERWNRMVAMFNSISNPPARYGEIAAAIGFARILRHFGMTNAALYSEALARVETGMAAGTNFNAFLATAYANFVGNYHDWAWTPFHYQRSGIAVGAMFAPEIGRFLHEFALDGVRRRTTSNPEEGNPGEEPAVTAYWPMWYLTRGYYPPIEIWMGAYGENHMVAPDTPWALFMTHAWVYNDTGPELRKYLDVPYNLGDLFYIQRLTATLAAYGNTVWSPVSPPHMAALQSVPGGLVLSATGGSDGIYVIEKSTNLAAWVGIATNAGPLFSITNSGLGIFQFFRAKVAP